MYRRGVADQNLGFVFVAHSGIPLGGASNITAYRIIDGGAQEAVTGAIEDKGNGQYNFKNSAADYNGSHISLLFTADNAFPVEKTVVTTAANPNDGDGFGLSRLDDNISNVLGKVILTITTPSEQWTDSDGNELSGITVERALAALLTTLVGDRSGVGTREITAQIPGVEDCSVTAERISRSVIEATVIVP